MQPSFPTMLLLAVKASGSRRGLSALSDVETKALVRSVDVGVANFGGGAAMKFEMIRSIWFVFLRRCYSERKKRELRQLLLQASRAAKSAKTNDVS